jgi:hypothetical protein
MLDSVDIDEISLNGGAKVDGLATQGRSPLHWAAVIPRMLPFALPKQDSSRLSGTGKATWPYTLLLKPDRGRFLMHF